MFLSKKSYTLEEATKKLEHYCAYQERCHQEVVKKLEGMQMIPEVIDVILVHLITHNFLNEERYAKTFVSGKLRIKYWGRRRLTFELQKKDISKFNINTALKSIDEEEYMEIFNSLAKRRQILLEKLINIKSEKNLSIIYFIAVGNHI